MKDPIYRRTFDYNRAMLPNKHLASLEEGVTTQAEAEQKTGLTIGYPGWGFIYYLLLSHLDRQRDEIIIETGTNQGCTTIVLAQALIDAGCGGHIETFELSPDNAAKAEVNLKAAGVEGRVNLHVGNSRETLAPCIAGMSGIRVAFLDASHLYADVMAEFQTLLPHLAEDAIVLFDNTYEIAEQGEDVRVNGALKEIAAEYGGNLINLEHVSWYTPGLAIWQKRARL